jgi:regulator of replication initiation timing
MSEQLNRLEDRVQRAARRLAELVAERQRLETENAELRARLRGLEAQVREQDAERADRRVDPEDLLAALEALRSDLRGDGAAP